MKATIAQLKGVLTRYGMQPKGIAWVLKNLKPSALKLAAKGKQKKHWGAKKRK